MNEKVMLLIDADNVSVDVVEQAIPWVARHFGGPHVRRAYCTAESAVKHQALFKRLAIRPMVNLAAGKNSTDIALAVDAVDLAISERPQTMVIASSDSDFAPLVARLREKGCRVVGIGQEGKTGEETKGVYDDYEVLVHRKSRAGAHPRSTATPPKPAPHPKPAARTAARHVRTTAAPASAVPAETPEAAPVAPPAAAGVSAAPPEVAVPTKKPARRRKKSPAPAPEAAPAGEAAPALSAPDTPAAPTAAPQALPDKVQAILAALPALVQGQTVELRVAAERLKDAGLLARRGSSTKLFGQFPEHFELQPSRQPNHVKALPRALPAPQ
jgi:hypothetical protein